MSQVQAGPRLSLAVLAATAVLLLTGLGWLDADAPDEPRALQIAEEMRSFEHGPEGLVLLHLNGEVYTQKPPLYYWLAVAAGAPGGRVSELAARLPSALAGIFVAWLTIHFGTRLLGSGSGVLGAAILVTVYEFAHLARRVQFDVLLTAFELGALASFWWLDRGLGRPRLYQALLHLCLGLAVLTKGPVGFLIPALTIVAFLLWERRPRDLARVFPLWGFVLSLGPGLVWISVATALAPEGYAATAVGENVFGRFFAGTSHVRPFYYYLLVFPQEFLPWTLAWPALFVIGRRQIFAAGADASTQRAWRLLLAAIAVSLVFFSLSSGKRGLYQLPIFPAAALLTADALLTWLAITAIGSRSGVADRTSEKGRMFIALLIAIGIGFHNLGEGLVVGAAFALGEAALGSFLVIGFILHNITEGIGIAAPVTRPTSSGYGVWTRR